MNCIATPRGGKWRCCNVHGIEVYRSVTLGAGCNPPPTSSLPPVDTPPVGNRIVVQENADDTLPAMNDSFTVSPPPSPVHASSPRRNVVHHSPDHAHLASHYPDPQPVPSDQLSFSIEDLFSTRVATLRHIPKTAQKEIASLKVAVWNDVLRDPEKPQRLDSRTCAHQINPLSAAWEENFSTEIQSCGGNNQSL